MRIAYGFYRPDSGEILVDGKSATSQAPHDAIALGIGMVHQHFMLVDPMTVAENIILGAEPGNACSSRSAARGKANRRFVGRVSPRHRSARHDREAIGRRTAAGGTAEGAVPSGKNSDSRRADGRADAA